MQHLKAIYLRWRDEVEDHPVIMAANLTGSVVAGGLVGGNLMGYLPDIASGMAIVIYTIQFCTFVHALWKRRKTKS
jgi:hypothetical protein